MPFRQQFESSGLGPCQNMVQAYFGGLDQAAQSYEPVMKGAARMQLEAMTLMSRRARAYMEVPARLAQVRTPQDLFFEQMGFWQSAFRQYAECSQRMMSAMGSMTPQAMMAAAKAPEKAPQRDYLSVPEAEPRSGTTGVREWTGPRRVA